MLPMPGNQESLDRGRPDGHLGTCKECHRQPKPELPGPDCGKVLRHEQKLVAPRNQERLAPKGLRHCSPCDRDLPIGDFNGIHCFTCNDDRTTEANRARAQIPCSVEGCAGVCTPGGSVGRTTRWGFEQACSHAVSLGFHMAGTDTGQSAV